MASKIGKTEWMGLYAITGIIDVIQIIIIFTGVGAGVNEAVDPFVGIGLLGYFQLRGVSMITQPQRALSLVGGEALGAITGGFAPAWIIDVWYIKRNVRKEKEAEEGEQAQAAMLTVAGTQPLNQGGVRQPVPQQRTHNPQDQQAETPNARITQPPLNSMGIRRPQK